MLKLNFELQKSKKENSILQAELHATLDKLDETSCKLKNHIENLNTLLSSNLTSMPWLAGMMADYLTYDIELEAKKLDWGNNIERAKKVASIRAIRADAAQKIEIAKLASYQLEYLRTLFPSLDDVLEAEYAELDYSTPILDSDPIRRFLTKEEWNQLSDTEKDQLALDRYVQSRAKSKWQIGRDYELSVCYEYSQKGYSVSTFGSYMGVKDLGRDLIAEKQNRTLIIQCKYWSKHKTIHEKHIFQLYGTVICYKIEHPEQSDGIHGVFITNTTLSEMAREVADKLGIVIVENHSITTFPRIKCNIGKDEFGIKTKIYHLPMDAQYDVTQIKLPGEFYAFTVSEAVSKGFRRSYRWYNKGKYE